MPAKMGLVLLVVAAGALAYVVGKAWAILIPLAVGSIATVAVAVGGSLSDTPIPFTIAIATIAAALGLMVRRQRSALPRT
jgi:hypothetical protein